MALATASPAHVELPGLQAKILSGTRFYGRAAFSDALEVLDLIDSAPTLWMILWSSDLPCGYTGSPASAMAVRSLGPPRR